MQKTAQKRSILNKLREMSNVSGIAAEKFFNPEFQRVMESLREKDSSIRAMVAGKEIDGADPGSDPISLKELLKSAKSGFNRREYMTAVANLGRFHKKLFDVVQLVNNLGLDVDKVHHEFLFKDLDEEHKKQLVDLKSRFASQQKAALIKEASIMDFFYNIGTKRGRALAAWEKRYPKQIGRLKKDTANLLGKSEATLSQVLSALKEMAGARAVRNIDNYMKGADKVVKAYQNYDRLFKDYYATNIKGFLEKVELISPTEKVPDAKELGKQEIPADTTPPSDNLPTIPAGPPSGMDGKKTMNIPTVVGPPISTDVSEPPSSPYSPTALAPGKVPTIPPAPGVPSVSDTTPSPPPSFPPAGEGDENFPSDQLAKRMWGKSSHQKFLASLESLSGESPALLASYIKRYAQSIQVNDLEASIELFKIAKSIKG